MTTDPQRQLLAEAAYVIRDAICRLNVAGEQIPRRWPAVLDAVNSALSAGGQPERPNPSRWLTTEQLAAEWNCTPRTVRRRAKAAGARKVNGGYVFEEGIT